MSFPLDITTELLLDGTWTDISSDVFQRDPIVIKRGRSDEAAETDPSTCDLTLNNTTGNYSPRNPAGSHYGVLGRNTQLRVRASTTVSENYAALYAGDGSAITTPDHASLDITGDIDIRLEIDPDTWRPLGNFNGSDRILAWKADDDEVSWSFRLTTEFYGSAIAHGALLFLWSTGGVSYSASAWSSVAVPADSGRLAVRVTLDVDNGAGSNDVRFYTAPSIDGTWTQLGDTDNGAGTTSIYAAGNAGIGIGSAGAVVQAETEPIGGKVYAFELRDGIGGTLVASPDFTTAETGLASFADAQGRTWSGAVIVNPNTRFHGEVSTWPPQWDTSGNDVYTPITASGVLRRLQASDETIASVMYRALTTQSGVVAYWPCEDGAGATTIASGLPGWPAMKIAGTPTLASFDEFDASSAIPDMGDAVFGGGVPGHASTNEIQLRFLMHVDAGGVASDTVVARIHTIGTAARWDLSVNAAGSLKLEAFDADDVSLHDTGFTAFDVNGRLLRVSVELERGATDIDMNVVTLEVGESTGSQLGVETLASQTLGRSRYITIAPTRGLSGVAIGHVSVENAITSMFDLSDELNAHSGEPAGIRIGRLCRQEGVQVEIIGDAADTALLGGQRPQTLLEVIREAAETDLGILYEPRGFLGLAYRTKASLYAQDPSLELDYTAADLSKIEPVEDDQATRNDVTVTRVNGASARAELTSGALSTSAPPDGVGRYAEQVTVSLDTDRDVRDQSTWRLHLGTVDEARYPVLGVNLARPNFTAEVGNFLSVNQASMETSVADWVAGGSVPPTLSQSATHAFDGTQALRIAWGTGGTFPLAQATVTGLVIGRTYTASGYGWVPTGDVGLAMAVSGLGVGAAMTTKDAFTRFYHSFTATDSTHLIQVWPDSSPTSGDLAWVDAVQVWEGSAPVTFTTTLAADTAPARAEALDVGDKITVANLPAWVSPDDTAQLAQGFTETLGRFEWLIDANCSPGSPWDVGVWDDTTGPGEARYESDGTTLAEDLTTGETAVDVTVVGPHLWSDADQPFDIVIGGERMTVTAVTGASSPQTFTVTRAVNGVVKTHSTGAEVRLFKQAIYAL